MHGRHNRPQAKLPCPAIGLALLLLTLLPIPTSHADVTSDQVRRAIERGVAAIKRQQNPDGTWPSRHLPGGENCLATLALLQAGEGPDTPAVKAALAHVSAVENQHTYVVALKIMALARADPQRYEQEIRAGARWLAEAQQGSGLWSYVVQDGRFDHSNSQFALLGLHTAAQAGITVPHQVWLNAQRALLRHQNEDGGWGYQAADNSYGSMTAAGVANLYILGHRIQVGRERDFVGGSARNCGEYRVDQPLVRGLNWLGQRFRVQSNPGRGGGHVLYWLYAVERCGVLSGRRYLGRHDWYRAGAQHLVGEQRANGTWDNNLVETSFALLFLAKGNQSLLIQKLQWSEDDAWNPDRYALEHLVSFIGEKFGEPVAWQTTQFDAPLEEWLAAPLLYIQGHEFPEWNEAQREKVREFVEQGGTLLAEACCGRKAFREGFERFAAATFPEFPLRDLGANHAVYHVHFNIKPYELQGIDLGCRTSVIYSPRDFSCPLEQGDIPVHSERAFQLGTNIAAYALGRRPLIDRLDVVVLPEQTEVAPTPPERDALRLCQVVYESDWRPFPSALVNLAVFCREEANLDVITQYRQVRLTDPTRYACPFLYMAGNYRFSLSAEELGALREHLQRGGFVLIDNCCGPEPFDTAVREFLRTAFPDSVLRKLPPDHTIFRGAPGFDVRRVNYGPDVKKERPELAAPELWGLEIDGRLALVYSPLALGCGWEGPAFAGCWGLASEDARRLGANIILYALTH